MIAGQLATLLTPTDEPLEDYHDSGQRAIEIDIHQTDLDGAAVQTGQVAGPVTSRRRVVTLDGHRIEEEQRKTSDLVASGWVADVVGGGWIVAESTHSTEKDHRPPWPFTTFGTVLGSEISPVNIDPGEFAQRQEDNERDTAVEFVGRRTGADDVSIEWGKGATQSAATSADVGVALTTFWNGEFVRVIVYQSGYLAAWEPEEWAPSAFARFVNEEVLPVAYIPEDDEEPGEQTTLGDSDDDFADDVGEVLDEEGVDYERGGDA